MTDTTPTQTQERDLATDEREASRPDLREVPTNPPVDQYDVERGREKLEQIIPK
jgi:hypothetical protein